MDECEEKAEDDDFIDDALLKDLELSLTPEEIEAWTLVCFFFHQFLIILIKKISNFRTINQPHPNLKIMAIHCSRIRNMMKLDKNTQKRLKSVH